jgi:BirA family biotin operon repressor/biotin-[acetyl-CoA-carboxylase] ligase
MSEYPACIGNIPVAFYDTIGSTNAEALTRAQSGELGPLIIVADRQSAGRGRRGRPWISEPGNLYATLLILDPAPAVATPQICFVAALALHDAVLDTCSGLAPTRLKLKWPNDLLLDGAKVSGILVEGTALSGNRIATAIGFGVNCRHHPQDTQFPANDFVSAGFVLSPLSLLERLVERWSSRIKEWSRGEGFAAIRSAWMLRAAGIGKSIEVRLLDRNVSGTFEAIDEQGALVLQKYDGEHEAISAGDVFPVVARVG